MILYIIYICIITENPVFIHAWFRPPLGFADATSRFPSGWVSALAWTWAKIMFGMVQKKISCMCMYIYTYNTLYIYIVTYGVYFVSTCLIPKWGRIRTPKPAPSRHGLEVIVLTFLLLPEQVLSSFNEDLLYIYIYSVWYCILYIYMYNYSFNEDLPACHGWMETTWFENTSPSKSLRKDCSFWLVWIMYLFMWFM